MLNVWHLYLLLFRTIIAFAHTILSRTLLPFSQVCFSLADSTLQDTVQNWHLIQIAFPELRLLPSHLRWVSSFPLNNTLYSSIDQHYLIEHCVWIFCIKTKRSIESESLSELCLLPLMRVGKMESKSQTNRSNYPCKIFLKKTTNNLELAYIKQNTFFPYKSDFCILKRWNFMSDSCCNLFGSFPPFR